MTQDDVVDQVAGDERLGEAEQGVEKDEQRAQDSFTPVVSEEGSQVLEISSGAGVTSLAGDTVVRQRAGEAMLQIGEPGIHTFSQSCVNLVN